MRKILLLVLAVLLPLFISSCSTLLMPYHENDMCHRGINSGYCGSIEQVYHQSIIDQEKEAQK